MANPRDLAEQAFTLLQDALRDSEARASELDEQLKRKRTPKNRLEEQLDVLTHRLEKVESERAHWEQQAGHLEEVAEAERVKVAQLKKKLEIAESGPEKLTKKEINYWRERAEAFDTETQEYKDRLAALLRTLSERDAQLAEIQNSPAATAAPAEGQPPADEIADELRRQVQQRDEWLSDLRLELHDLRTQAAGTPEPPIETLAEIETLRHQVASLDKALADAHNTRASAQADLQRAQQDLATRERACREAEAAAERTQALVREREHRLVELSAQFEQLRNEAQQREHHFRAESAEHTEQIAALSRELTELRARAEQSRQATASNEAELANARDARALAEQRLAGMAAALERAEAALIERTRRHDEAQAAVARLETHVAQRERELAAHAAQVLELGRRLAEQEQLLGSMNGDLERAKATAAANDREIASLRETLQAVGRDLDQTRGRNRSLEAAEAEARANAEALVAELAAARERLGTELAAAREQLESETAARERLGNELAIAREQAVSDLTAARQRLETESTATRERFDTELAALRDRLEGQLAVARERVATLEAERNEHRRRADGLSDELTAAREQIAGLEAELKEEKEHAENLGELANERREHMTKLQEQLEEAEERYAEADWRLGKAAHFERLVLRRKGLIAKLLAALRAKMKANVALKAGLDGLRTYKASAEANQQKLLQRLDKLKAELTDAEETIKKHQGATHTKEELERVESRASSLEERLNTQAEIIQSLETELKAARLAHPKSDDHASQELEQLRAELETKNQVIAKLQADTDEQQRKLAKLRGSESETMRLRAVTEKDRGEIDALQREVVELREALSRQSAAATASAGDNPELSALLRERDQTITRLTSTIKEHEATIKKINESAEGWKRKYQFLAADAPEAYKSATEH